MAGGGGFGGERARRRPPVEFTALSRAAHRVARLSLKLASVPGRPLLVPLVPVLLAEAAAGRVVLPGAEVRVPTPLSHPHLPRGLPVPLGVLDLQGVPVDVVAVQLVQRFLRVSHVLVLDVGEPARLLRVVVQRDVHVRDGTVLGEDGTQLLGLGAVGEVPYEQGGVWGAAIST